ncbi:unnamed protein product, partial [Mesorhabditis spiculigera]
MGFRHKGLNYALNTKRFPPSKNGKYGTCFQFGMRRFGVGEIIWMADGIFGKEAISQGRVRLKAAWLSFLGQFGLGKTYVGVSYKVDGKRKYWYTPSVPVEHQVLLKKASEEMDKRGTPEKWRRLKRFLGQFGLGKTYVGVSYKVDGKRKYWYTPSVPVEHQVLLKKALELQLAEEPSKTYGFPVPLALLVMPDDPPLIKITHRRADQTAWNEVKKRPLDYFGWDNNCGCYEGMITILRTSTGGYEISFNTHKGPFHYTSTEENMIATFLVVRDPAIVGVKHHRAGKQPISMMLTRGKGTPRPPEEHVLKRIRDWESVKAQPFKVNFNPHFPIYEVMHFFDNDDDHRPQAEDRHFGISPPEH